MSGDLVKKEVNEFYNIHFFVLNKQFQSLCGVWPSEPGLVKYPKQAFMALIVMLNLILYLHAMTTLCGINVDFCSENMVASVYSFTALFKIICMSTTQNKFLGIYALIMRNWNTITDPKESSILEYWAGFSKLLTRLYIVSFFITAAGYTQAPLVPLFLNVIMPRNESRQPLTYLNTDYSITPYTTFWHQYVHFTFTGIGVGSLFIAIDTTFILIVFQILGTFDIVKHRVRQAALAEDEHSNESYEILVNAAKLHKDAIECLDLTNDANSLQFLIVLGGTILLVSFGAISILSRFGEMADIFRLLVLVLGYLFQLVVLSVLGQLIINSSSELFEVATTTEWYNLPQKSKKFLLFFMMRTINPSYYTAGGLYTMNFENFAAIMKTAVSYITVVLSFR